MSTTEVGQEFLEHYGVKGMKWGVKGGASKRGKQSKDYEQASTLASKGSKALSNDELRTALNRIQMERQYSQLTATPSKAAVGLSVVKKALDVGNTANNIVAFSKSPIGQEIAKAMAAKRNKE